jgi:Uma2 family endonuclease
LVQTIDFAELVRIGDELDAEKPYVELIDGLEVRKMSPKTRHSFVQGAFTSILRAWAAGRGVVGPEWRFWLVPVGGRRTSLVPDVAYLSKERFAQLEGDAREMPPMAPDIAVEIRSPGDRPRNISRKIELYLGHGSQIVLDVDPKTRTIVVHDRTAVRTLYEGDRFEHAAASGLTFVVREVFAEIV